MQADCPGCAPSTVRAVPSGKGKMPSRIEGRAFCRGTVRPADSSGCMLLAALVLAASAESVLRYSRDGPEGANYAQNGQPQSVLKRRVNFTHRWAAQNGPEASPNLVRRPCSRSCVTRNQQHTCCGRALRLARSGRHRCSCCMWMCWRSTYIRYGYHPST